jgi:hypothetical protein
MKRIFVFCALVLAIAACNKDKVESTPHLKFKSFNQNPLVDTLDEELRVILDFTDQEGDLDSVYMTRVRLNKSDPSPKYTDANLGVVPKFGNQNRGEIQVKLNLRIDLLNVNALRIPGSNPSRYETDTLLMRFYVKDKAGHTSDTAVAKPLYIIRTS